MVAFVDYRYKIHIYLDTNILVDYVEQNNPLLNKSLEYLSACPFVILRSSHYVEFEFVEVRKRDEFYKCVRGSYPPPDGDKSFSKKWILDGNSYKKYKDTVTNQVEGDLKKIREKLNINFDDHVLHEKLIEPTKDICLSTNISREDTLVMVSCLFPKPLEKLDFGVILSNDGQYKDAFENSKETIEKTLNNNGISVPSFLSIKQLRNETGKIVNLNVQDSNVDILSLWNWIIKQMIIKKHFDNYVGETITPMKNPPNCVAFKLANTDQIKESEAILFITGDLSQTISVLKKHNYWNNNVEIQSLPYTNENDLEYSLEISCVQEDLNILSQKGNLVFYDNL